MQDLLIIMLLGLSNYFEDNCLLRFELNLDVLFLSRPKLLHLDFIFTGNMLKTKIKCF